LCKIFRNSHVAVLSVIATGASARLPRGLLSHVVVLAARQSWQYFGAVPHYKNTRHGEVTKPAGNATRRHGCLGFEGGGASLTAHAAPPVCVVWPNLTTVRRSGGVCYRRSRTGPRLSTVPLLTRSKSPAISAGSVSGRKCCGADSDAVEIFLRSRSNS